MGSRRKDLPYHFSLKYAAVPSTLLFSNMAAALMFPRANLKMRRLRKPAPHVDVYQAIPIKCFVSHRPPSREGGSVGRAKKKKNEHMIAY